MELCKILNTALDVLFRNHKACNVLMFSKGFIWQPVSVSLWHDWRGNNQNNKVQGKEAAGTKLEQQLHSTVPLNLWLFFPFPGWAAGLDDLEGNIMLVKWWWGLKEFCLRFPVTAGFQYVWGWASPCNPRQGWLIHFAFLQLSRF